MRFWRLGKFLLWIEEDGDVVGGEGAFASRRTCSHCGLVIFARHETAFELIGYGVEAGRGVTHDVPGLARTRVTAAHRAGLAGVLGGFGDAHSGLCEDAGNGAFLLVERKNFDGAGEVFYGVELVVTGDDGNPDRIDVWIEQVSAMAGGVHPEIVDDDGAWSFSYIFGDEAKVRASIGAARCEFGLAVELVGDVGVVGHLAGVLGGGFAQDGIEADRWKSLIGAGFIGGGEEILLGDGEIVLWGGGVLGVEIGAERGQRESCDRERFRQ
jgi:hypothetical protein